MCLCSVSSAGGSETMARVDLKTLDREECRQKFDGFWEVRAAWLRWLVLGWVGWVGQLVQVQRSISGAAEHQV